MKLVVWAIFLVGVLGVVSCEKESDPSDFVPQDLFEEAIGIGGDDDDDVNVNLPTLENPVFIGEFNDFVFNAIDFEATQVTIDVDNILLTLFFEDLDGNQLILQITNPETTNYVFGENETATFEANFFDNITDESFSVTQRLDANSNKGNLMLVYTENGDNITVSAQFTFTAFLETELGVAPSRFVDFTQGQFVDLPVGIVN